MVTIVYLMKALGGSKHVHEIEELIMKLVKVDPMRKEYYKDLSMYSEDLKGCKYTRWRTKRQLCLLRNTENSCLLALLRAYCIPSVYKFDLLLNNILFFCRQFNEWI